MTPAECESLAGLMDAEAQVSGDFCRAQVAAGVHPDSPMVAMMRMSAATWRDAARMVRAWNVDEGDGSPGWIAVAERLPRDEELTLIACPHHPGWESGFFCESDGTWMGEYGEISGVRYWMPVPNPPNPPATPE